MQRWARCTARRTCAYLSVDGQGFVKVIGEDEHRSQLVRQWRSWNWNCQAWTFDGRSSGQKRRTLRVSSSRNRVEALSRLLVGQTWGSGRSNQGTKAALHQDVDWIIVCNIVNWLQVCVRLELFENRNPDPQGRAGRVSDTIRSSALLHTIQQTSPSRQ